MASSLISGHQLALAAELGSGVTASAGALRARAFRNPIPRRLVDRRATTRSHPAEPMAPTEPAVAPQYGPPTPPFDAARQEPGLFSPVSDVGTHGQVSTWPQQEDQSRDFVPMDNRIRSFFGGAADEIDWSAVGGRTFHRNMPPDRVLGR